MTIKTLAFAIAIGTSFHIHAQKPNIVVILVDDMGYFDLGCFGSEINTPNPKPL